VPPRDESGDDPPSSSTWASVATYVPSSRGFPQPERRHPFDQASWHVPVERVQDRLFDGEEPVLHLMGWERAGAESGTDLVSDGRERRSEGEWRRGNVVELIACPA
jgi:hypothetical protein